VLMVDQHFFKSPTKDFKFSDGSGSKIFDPGQVGSAIYGLGLNWENFP